MGWDEDLILATFTKEAAEAIIKLEWPEFWGEDKLVWCGNPKGLF